jgi:hypothetical protein
MTSTVSLPQPHPITHEAAISDAALQGARAAVDRLGDPYKLILMPDPGPNSLNRPVLPLLMALLDATQATANALAENAWDSFEPIDKDRAAGLIKQCEQIIAQIDCATHATPPQ